MSAYRFHMDDSKCIGCGVCVETCDKGVLELRDGQPFAVNQDNCEGCEVCVAICDQGAITVEEVEND